MLTVLRSFSVITNAVLTVNDHCTCVMLIFILTDVQYLHNDLFSFEKRLIHQNHYLNPHNPIKNPPTKFSFPYPFYVFGRPWSILESLLCLLHMLIICLKLTYYFYIQMALNYFQHTISKKSGKNLPKKLRLVC